MTMAGNAGSVTAQLRLVDLFLVSFNSAHLLAPLRSSLSQAEAPGVKLRVLAVDNASSDGSGDILRDTFPCDMFIQNQVNVGFGRANNQLVEHVRGDYVLLLNTDAFVSPETVRTSVEYMDRHLRCGILGVKLTGSDGSPQPSRRSFPTPFTTFIRRTGLYRYIPIEQARDDLTLDHDVVSDCDWVPGCYYLVRRAVLDEIGLFDPRFFMYFEEVDHCRRARNAGWTVTYLASTSVVHLGGESAKSVSELSQGRQISALQVESELLYMRKHFGLGGLVWHLALVVLGDAILAVKELVRTRSPRVALRQFLQTRASWKLAGKTRFGVRPTR
jgi:N-acetylglucosaminyl-diphospho-decaprenol L-rhamnosyltransferase